MSKLEDFLRCFILYLGGDSLVSSLSSLDIVESLCRLLIRLTDSTPTFYILLLVESLMSGELEFPLSEDLFVVDVLFMLLLLLVFFSSTCCRREVCRGYQFSPLLPRLAVEILS